ncbi:hypothetical protein [Paenibacillus humicola]|uniref:hypothetical protein n=1 Tax=Paenibacillus humicola TaxID=3110540 RepID=UPI00237A485F|nr:hypothetical protein [Paenibacillus humicola]
MKINNKISEGNPAVTVVLYVLAAIVCVVTLYPMYYVLILSVSEPAAAATMQVYMAPKGFNLSSYSIIVKDPQLWRKALTVVNAHERRSQVHIKEMEAGLKLIAKGQLNMKEMITHVFSLHEIDRAYEAIRTKPQGFVKSVIKID